MPGIVGLLSLRANRPEVRAAILLASALLVTLASFVAFSTASLLLLLAAVLLALAAATTYGSLAARPTLRGLLPFLLITMMGIASWIVLVVHPDPGCWVITR